MRLKNTVVFIAIAAISLFAGAHRFRDSGHAIGLIKARGAEARHPVILKSGKDRYTVIVTATVMPPYSGDARMVLEGDPAMDYRIYSSKPVIDFSLRRRPVFRDDILYDLRPMDRLALWMVMKPSTPARGKYTLAFCDTRTDNSILRVPVIFGEGTENGSERHD